MAHPPPGRIRRRAGTRGPRDRWRGGNTLGHSPENPETTEQTEQTETRAARAARATSMVPTDAAGGAHPPPAPDGVATGLPGGPGVVLRRVARRPGGLLGAALLLGVVGFAVLGPLLSPWGVGQQDVANLGVAPGVGGHLLGTDPGGFDLLAMLAEGTGRSLLVAGVVGVCTPALGAAYGATIALWGGRRERVGMWLLDMAILLPAFLLVAVAMSAADQAARDGHWAGAGSAWTLAVLLTLFGWMPLARVVRALTRSLREREFVRAARYLGLSTAQIARRHVLPHLASYLVLAVVLGTSAAIVTETLLSYLGIGVRPPEVSLGQLVGRSASQLYAYPWLFWAPTIVLVWITLGLALLGDALRDALDPRSSTGRRA